LHLVNVGAERISVVDCSTRPDQPHKMSGCRVVALFWVYDLVYEDGGLGRDVFNNKQPMKADERVIDVVGATLIGTGKSAARLR